MHPLLKLKLDSLTVVTLKTEVTHTQCHFLVLFLHFGIVHFIYSAVPVWYKCPIMLCCCPSLYSCAFSDVTAVA